MTVEQIGLYTAKASRIREAFLVSCERVVLRSS